MCLSEYLQGTGKESISQAPSLPGQPWQARVITRAGESSGYSISCGRYSIKSLPVRALVLTRARTP